MSSVHYQQHADGSVWYNLAYGSVTLHEDYLVWDQGVVTSSKTQIYYTDIISVSASDGGLLFGNAFLQLNTAGRTYTISALAKINGFCYVKEQIEKKMATAKSKPKSNSQSVSTADEIAKYKDLADKGVISKAEFEAKKKQLLGL